MTKGKRWTLAEKEQLRELFEQGHVVNHVAREMNRTPLACVAQAWKMGISIRWKSKSTPARRPG